MHKANAPKPAKALTAAQLQGCYQDRYLALDAVQFLTSLSRSTIYSRMAADDFPCAFRIHGNRVAWKESDINTWLASRPVATAMQGMPKK